MSGVFDPQKGKQVLTVVALKDIHSIVLFCTDENDSSASKTTYGLKCNMQQAH